MSDPSTESREHWRDEMQSAWLYRRLADVEPESRIRELFLDLANEAESQARRWLPNGAPEALVPSRKARIAVALASRLGPRRIKPLLASLKVRGLSAYSVSPPGHALPRNIDEVGRGHRQFGGGNLRAAVFGINDGLVSNASLILGMVGADASTGTVLTTGVAGLLAGAMSMAAGEFVSVRSQRELFEHQIALERDELAQYPDAEAAELALIYEARGLAADEAKQLATRLVSNPSHALDVLAREELGLNPDELGSPIGAAGFSFAAFTVGAAVPLLPFFLGLALPGASYVGATLAACGLFATGASMGLLSGRSAFGGGVRMLAIGGGAGVTTYLIGGLVGGLAG